LIKISKQEGEEGEGGGGEEEVEGEEAVSIPYQPPFDTLQKSTVAIEFMLEHVKDAREAC
jgi:hypothetical protein